MTARTKPRSKTAGGASPRIEIGRASPLWGVARYDGLIRRAAAAALAVADAPAAPDREISVLLTDDAAMKKLNCVWRGKQKPTNVLSFPAAARGTRGHLGDVVLAHETVAAEALAEGTPFEHHVAHLVVHGVLHLLGHDHTSDREAVAMERRETRALASLGIADPYAVPAPVRRRAAKAGRRAP